jgi:nucleoside-diphosphate-sugar epimerase
MKVFIAGATGALGLPLVRELVARGHEVIGLTRSPAKRSLLENVGARAAVADVFDAAELERAVRAAAPTHVVHMLSALPKNGPLRAADIASTNQLRIVGTANLLRAAIAAGVRRIVGESFSAVYGYGDLGERPRDEDDLPPIRESDAGARAVVEALRSLEDQLLAANAQGAIESVVLRYGMTYGPENASTLYMIDMLRKRWLPLVRGAKGIGSFIHVDDAATATIAALERGRPGAIYNIVDDEPASLNAYLSALAQATGARRPPALPRWLVGLAAPMATSLAQTRLPLSNARARRELDWRPRFPSYREGVRQVARQVRAPAAATPTRARSSTKGAR